MIAAAPEGSPPRRISNKQFKKTPAPPCLGEALRRGSIVYITIFMAVCFYIALLFGSLTKTSLPPVLRDVLMREIPLHESDFILPGWVPDVTAGGQ